MTIQSLKDTNLFKPLKVGNITLQNRVALAPLTRNRSDEKFTLPDIAINYYEQRSRRPGTLLISEATSISLKAIGQYQPPGIFTEDHYKIWKKVIDVIHKNHSFIFIQIWALGAKGDPKNLKSRGLKYVSASDNVYLNSSIEATAKEIDNPVHGLTKAEIKDYISDFVNASKKAVELGADGIEIHGANGYLPFQFLYDGINKRTDEYGGSFENRARFLLEITDALIEAIGHAKVGVRISPWFVYEGIGYEQGSIFPLDSNTFEQYVYLVKEFEKRKQNGKELAYVHIVEPRVDLAKPTKEIPWNNEEILSNYSGVVIRANGYNENKSKLIKDVSSNDKTAIAFGRYFISNPDLPDRLENDYPLNPYDRSTFYTPGGDKVGYIDQPFYGKEPEF